MSNPKFTPGPWVKDKYGRLIGSNGDQVEVSNFNINVCYSTEESEANAILLECATQMHDTIESLSRELHSMIEKENNRLRLGIRKDDYDEPEYIDMQSIHEANQLLAKARG